MTDPVEFMSSLSNWGRWGDDDQLGALNFVRPEQRRAAAALVRSGRTVGCARELSTVPAADNPFPVAHHMIATSTEGWGGDYFAIAFHGHATSHIDALCHVFWDGRIHNGHAQDTVTAHGAEQLGIHALADGVQGRGVLLDIARLKGVDHLERGQHIVPADLDAAEAAEGVAVGSGDILLVRTGRWADRDANGPWPHGRLAAGLDASCLPWLHEREVAVLGCDGISDAIPSGYDSMELPVHAVAIVAMGVHLLDNLDLERLGAACLDEERWEFQLTLAPLVLAGGTGSPLNPIATF